jgi:hypothetical protein
MGTEKANPTITTINSQTGIYFDEMGQLHLYTTQWKIISYADLKPIQLLWKQVKDHQLKISESCNIVKNETWYHLTDCHAFASYIRSKVKYIDQLKGIKRYFFTTIEEEKKKFEHFSLSVTTWASVLMSIVILVTCICCSCCCCKCCRQIGFWIWEKWTP